MTISRSSVHRLWGSVLTMLLPLFSCTVANAQSVLSPVPQMVRPSEGTTLVRPASFRLVGQGSADASAVSLLCSRLSISEGKQSIPIYIGECGEKAVKRVQRHIPTQSEGYYLSLSQREIVVAGRDEAGTYYGVQTLLQLLSDTLLTATEVIDYPQMPERGVIEGYYGNPYSHQDRLRLFDFMGEQKMNVFVYGPKDDPYHRSHWRDPYPSEEIERMKQLIERARMNHVKFVWAIHPGGDIRWNLDDSLAIVRKCERMYDIGVRSFCVFFDDIGGEGARGEKQAALLNYMTDEFVRKHSDVEPLMMCPTQYNKSWSGGPYLNTLGTVMYPEVRIMWTGATVIDMIDRADMEWINDQIKRKAYIWLNYPVTDYCIDHLLMGKTYGNGLDIGEMVSGFCSNPMEYCEASKLSLYSIADYTWNPRQYNDQRSWERAIDYLMPAHREAFRTFCENNVDLGITGHGLRREGESPLFQAVVGDEEKLEAYFQGLIHDADELLDDQSQPELSAEIRPWVQSMKATGERGLSVLAMRKNLKGMGETEKVKGYHHFMERMFVRNYLNYKKQTEAQRDLRSRDFPGSIKIASPVVATNFVEPWLKEQTQTLIDAYKQQSNYGADVFPQQLLAQGTYFIKANGKYLTDTDPRQPNLQAAWIAERDTINPQRQEWTVTLNANTGRYQLVNNQARRYLNEVGRFGANPYNENWNTYELTLKDGRYAIRNAQNGGTDYWTVSPDGRFIGFTSSEPFWFEIVPVE